MDFIHPVFLGAVVKNFYKEDTIAALSTPPGEGGIAIIRVSGSDAWSIVYQLYIPYRGKAKPFTHHGVVLGYVSDPKTQKRIDEALFIAMKAPNSYTAEDVVEIQCHGGYAAASSILTLLHSMGVREALPGEFTKRAFLNGRIDLLQAEAVMDLIHANTSVTLDMAEEQLRGKFSHELQIFKQELISISASLEAPLEYPDEDFFVPDTEELYGSLDSVLKKAQRMKELCEGGKILKAGIKTAIAGKPNVGKSSILNLLLSEDRAIVTEFAGTTRDTIEEAFSADGTLLTLVDTAGLRAADDSIEKLGIEKSRNAIKSSDFVLAIFDLSRELEKEDFEILEFLKELNRPFIIVLNKRDKEQKLDLEQLLKYSDKYISISAKDPAYRSDFIKFIAKSVNSLFRLNSANLFSASRRQLSLISELIASLNFSISAIKEQFPLDMISVGLREAISIISELSGESFDEAVLDKIFSEFCVGK